MTGDYVTVSQFASSARITPQAVRKMIKQNRLAARKIGYQYVIRKEYLQQYIDKVWEGRY